MTATLPAPTDARTEAWRRWLRSLLNEQQQPATEQQQPQPNADPPAPECRAGD